MCYLTLYHIFHNIAILLVIQNAMLTYNAFSIIIIATGGVAMSFQLKPNKKETENKTVRFPIPLIDRIEDAIQNQDVTFSSFVIQACEYALNDMDNDKKGE